MTTRDILVIARECNRTLQGLIKRILQKFKSLPDSTNDLLFVETLQRRVSLAIGVDETIIVKEAFEHIMQYSERIIDNDNLDWMIGELDTFTTAGVVAAEKNMIEALIDIVKRRYSSMSATEKKMIYDNVKTIHDDCLEFSLCS